MENLSESLDNPNIPNSADLKADYSLKDKLTENGIIKNLPEKFIKNMKEILPEDEWEDFFESFSRPPEKALRINETLLKRLLGKCLTEDGILNIISEMKEEFGLEELPEQGFFSINGHKIQRAYYINSSNNPGLSPLQETGLYYIQSPEAMKVVPELSIRPYDRVLDMCASPGGKSLQALDCLSEDNGGFLIANEFSTERAKKLSSNFERMGVRTAAVLNEDANNLPEIFPEYFTRIILDAPCSGEGMFRKNPSSIEEWSEENVDLSASRQKALLFSAEKMLSPGGIMTYSTCTYEKKENEDRIRELLEKRPNMHLLREKRFFPHKDRGEGHYMALLKKDGEDSFSLLKRNGESFEKNKDVFELIKKNDGMYLKYRQIPPLKGVRIIRNILPLFENKGHHLVPSHILSHAFPDMINSEGKLWKEIKKEFEISKNPLNMSFFDLDEKAVKNYLSGETVYSLSDKKGWIVLCYKNIPLGIGKISGGIIKNHYPKGLRT